MSKRLNTIQHAVNCYAYPMPTIETVINELEAENTKLREGLEKFRGQFDCYECTGTAEGILDSLKDGEENS